MAVAGVIALLDWWAVGTDRRGIERWAKPGVMVFLIAAAALIPAESDWIRWWIVIGLAFGLIGDVLLFQDRFIPGAAAFLVGHVAYIVALVPIEHGGNHPSWAGSSSPTWSRSAPSWSLPSDPGRRLPASLHCSSWPPTRCWHGLDSWVQPRAVV